MVRSGLCFDLSGTVAVIFAAALMTLMGAAATMVDLDHANLVRRKIQQVASAGVNAQVRALTLPDYTSFPDWNNALAATTATVKENIAAVAVLNDFNADISLQKIPTGFRDHSGARDTALAGLKGYLDPAGYDTATFDPPLEPATSPSLINHCLDSGETFDMARPGVHLYPERHLFYPAG